MRRALGIATLVVVALSSSEAQRTDTVVKRVDKPLHAGVATLRRELTIGTAGGEQHYMLGAIADLAVGSSGNIYVWDRSVPAIRMYDPAGKYIRTIGAKGAGPGEYQAGAAIAIAKNGNLLMWDPGNARINVWSPTGVSVTSWPTLSGGSGAAAGTGLMTVDTAGVVYIHSFFGLPRRGGALTETRAGWLRFSPTGPLIDTLLPPPRPDWKGLTAESGRGQFSNRSVPFMPGYSALLSPFGYLVTGMSDGVALDINERGKPVVSIRRDVVRQRVTASERDSARNEITAEMRQVQPTWSWNGPEIPALKPAYTTPLIDADGRIWLQLAEGPRRADDTTGLDRGQMVVMQGRAGVVRPQLPWSCPRAGWTLYDVYEPRGAFLGHVRIPERVDPIVMRGDMIWGVTCDDDDVPSVGRYRILWR